MASIAKVGRGGGGGFGPAGLSYYLSYVERGGEPGRWLGQGATALGLTGVVEADALVAVGEGRHPETGAALVVTRGDRVPAWDVTFSAPKSVSVLYGLADGEARRVIKSAHDQAVTAAVGWLEAHGGRARRGAGGRDGHVPVKLVVAGFAHGTSRAVDPDLHTHCLVANLGVDSTGRWSALDSRVLYRRKMAAGAVYRAELRRITSEAGLQWRSCDRRGLSELAGVPTGVLRVFSKRRVEIEQALASHATVGPKASGAAALATRTAKVDVEFTEAQGRWRAEAAGYGWTRERAEQLVLAGRDPYRADCVDRDAALGWLLSPAGLTRSQATFTRDDVLRAWAGQLTQGSSAAELDRLVNATLADPDVIRVADGDNLNGPTPGGADDERVRAVLEAAPRDELREPRYTTTEMLAVEGRMVATATSRRGRSVGAVPLSIVDGQIARGGVAGEQATMVREICTSGDGVLVVVGVPGSGKTTGLAVARAGWESAGYRVLGCALAGRAADELAKGAGIESATIDSFLAGSLGPLTDRTVVVVDEAGMVDTRRLAALVRLTAEANSKLVLVGDDRQLPAVEAGGGFSTLASRLPVSRLTGNRRQVEEWQRQALAAIRDGRTAEAVAAYLDHGNVKVADTAFATLDLMVDDWWAAHQAGDLVAMYAYTRNAAAELNSRARSKLLDAGLLGARSMRVPPASGLGERRFAAGDQIVCLRNRRRLPDDPTGNGVRNGTFATVIDVHTDRLVAETDGRVVHLPAEYVMSAVDHGYATSLHKGQGRTVGDPKAGRTGSAFVYGASGLSAEAALVAASRATHATRLYVIAVPPPEPTSHGEPEPIDAGEQLRSGWSRSEHKQAGIDLSAHTETIRQLASLPPEELHQRWVSTLEGAAGHQPDADMRSIAAEWETLVAAQRLQQRQRVAALAADPPEWLTQLIGPPPTDDTDLGSGHDWWQAATAALTVRPSDADDQRPMDDSRSSNVWERATGVDFDCAAQRWPGAVRAIGLARQSARRRSDDPTRSSAHVLGTEKDTGRFRRIER